MWAFIGPFALVVFGPWRIASRANYTASAKIEYFLEEQQGQKQNVTGILNDIISLPGSPP